MKMKIEHDGLTYIIGECLIEALKEGKIDALAHQTNCRGVMGSGIAGMIAREFPEVALQDVHYCNANLYSNGDVRVAGTCDIAYTNNDLRIFNLYGQIEPGRNTSYELLSSAIYSMFYDYIECDYTIVALGFPLIGCGIGGGDWSEVSGIIKDNLKKFPDLVDVFVYVLDFETFCKVVLKK